MGLAIARNVVTDHFRFSSRVEMDGAQMELTDEAHGPETEVELRDLAGKLHSLILGLSPRDATALTMVCSWNAGPKEVAAALGISPSSAKVVLHRARRRLLNALVLQAVAQGGLHRCPDLAEVVAQGVVPSSEHVVRCPACLFDLQSEFELFSLEPMSGRCAPIASPDQRSLADQLPPRSI